VNAAAISTVVIAALALLAAGGSSLAWFYRRGQAEQSLANSVAQHAQATTELAAQVGGLRKTLEDHGQQLTDHHYRIKALETRRLQVQITDQAARVGELGE
jgi:phage shock protein A